MADAVAAAVKGDLNTSFTNSFDYNTAVLGNVPSHPGLFSTQAADIRFRLELAWMEKLQGLSRAASGLLAARAVGCMMAINPTKYGAVQDDAWLSQLASARPDRETLEAASSELASRTSVAGALTPADIASIDSLWLLTAPVELLLASGGDERLDLNPTTGCNKYGCTPWPRPHVVSFGSCTASNPSEGAFEAAERARRALVALALKTSPAFALAQASEKIATAVLKHFEVEELAEAVIAASGTDAALLVTGLLAAERPGEALTSVIISPSETGSGVPHAVRGQHFAARSPGGRLVEKGTPIDGLVLGPALLTIAVRDETGLLRTPADVSANFEDAIRTASRAGHVVLHAVVGSKTGLTAPDREDCRRLAQKYGSKLDIVIDACQARIEPPLIRWYLQNGFPVLVTGSKFFSAPGFCGAVLFPRARLHRITRARRLPAGLAAYANLQGSLESRRCPGLVLRWTAALHEMAIFGQLPADLVGAVLDRIGRAVAAGFARESRLRLLAAPRSAGLGWSRRPSVFTFAVHEAEGLMSLERLRRLHRDLSEKCATTIAGGDLRCQLGQPVQLGEGGPGGLRIAISASQITSGSDQSDPLMLVLEKLGTLLDYAARRL